MSVDDEEDRLIEPPTSPPTVLRYVGDYELATKRCASCLEQVGEHLCPSALRPWWFILVALLVAFGAGVALSGVVFGVWRWTSPW